MHLDAHLAKRPRIKYDELFRETNPTLLAASPVIVGSSTPGSRPSTDVQELERDVQTVMTAEEMERFRPVRKPAEPHGVFHTRLVSWYREQLDEHLKKTKKIEEEMYEIFGKKLVDELRPASLPNETHMEYSARIHLWYQKKIKKYHEKKRGKMDRGVCESVKRRRT